MAVLTHHTYLETITFLRAKEYVMNKKASSPDNRKKYTGYITSVRGNVVDITFPEWLPPINTLIQAGEEGQIIIEAADHLDENMLRGIALNSTSGLFRGEKAWTIGDPLLTPVGKRESHIIQF